MNLRGLSDKELSRLEDQVTAEQKRRADARPPAHGSKRSPLSEPDKVILGIVRERPGARNGWPPTKAQLLKRACDHIPRGDAQAAFTRLREAGIIYFDLGGYCSMWPDVAIQRGWQDDYWLK